MEKNEGNVNMELDGESYQDTCVLPERHDPCYSPYTFVAPQAHCSNITSSTRGVAEQIESEPVESDRAFTEAHGLFLADDLLSEDSQDYNLNAIFDRLKYNFPPVTSPVQNKSPKLEGRSVPGDHVNALHPKPLMMNQPSDFGWEGKRKATEAGEVAESRVFRRKYLDTEHSEEADPRVSPSNTVPNFVDGEIDLNNTSRRKKIDVDESEQPQDVQYEQQKNSNDVRDPHAVTGNYNDLCQPGIEVMPKTMGWFPVEEYPNEDNDTNRSVRWILDEPPSASDLPHLESLLEISPSQFWSPKSESRKRPPIRFGYLCCSESSQSSHSIQYFLNDTPDSSPEVTRIIHRGSPSVRISSKESNHRCSQACPEFHGMAQSVLTPVCMHSELMVASMKSPSLGSDRKRAAQVQEGVPEISPTFSEDNPEKNTSREQNVVSIVHQYRTHHQAAGCVAKSTASESAARRLQLSVRGKNLVRDFLKAETTQGKIEARLIRSDIQDKDTTVQPSSTLWAQVENTILPSDKMRPQCSTGLSTEEREHSLLSLERQIRHGVDGNCLMKRDSPLRRPLSSALKLKDRLQGDQNCTKKRDPPSVPLSDALNHPNLAKMLRNSLHEKLESQLIFPKPVSESLSNERLVTAQSLEVAPDNIGWSTTGIPRVSRKRSSRITTPKLTRVEVLNMFGNGKVAQPVRTTPNKDYYTCKRRRTSKMTAFEELPTVPRNFKLWHRASIPTSDCETDLRKMAMQEGIRPSKPPTLTKIVKPLRLIKSPPAKGYPCVRIKPRLKCAVGKGLPTDPRNVNPLQLVKKSPVKHPPDVNRAVLTPRKNSGVSGEATQRHAVKEESLSKLPADCTISKIPALRSSKYRGVTRHRHTGRYEAHLWDNSKMKLGLAKRGRQVYLGAYPDEDQAAQAHDLAALKYWGPGVYTNFPPSLYEEELKKMEKLTREEYVVTLRRRSPGFTRGISKYRGVTRHHQEGRWEARIGRHSGAKYHYLGTYDTQEEAAAAYDRAAVRHRGAKAITNFDISNYIKRKI